MPLLTRWTLMLVLLGSGVLGQLALRRHLAAAGEPAPQPLRKPLAELPLALRDWRGQDQRIDDPGLLIGDERLRRSYRREPAGMTAEVWLVYSREAEDRLHHPEVCMAVAGQVEDPAGREAVAVPGHAAPVQQYRFGSGRTQQLVYYWHYTLPAAAGGQLDALQLIHQYLRWRPASVTIEVFAPERSPDDRKQAQDLVRQIDAALQSHLPPKAVRGSQRLLVRVADA